MNRQLEEQEQEQEQGPGGSFFVHRKEAVGKAAANGTRRRYFHGNKAFPILTERRDAISFRKLEFRPNGSK